MSRWQGWQGVELADRLRGRQIMETKSGTLWGVNWERHTWGVYCYAMGGNFYLLSRKYVGDGSGGVSVRDSVRAFRRDVLGVTA